MVAERKTMDGNVNQASSMAMVVLPQSAWEGLNSDIQEVKEMLKSKKCDEGSGWMDSSDARKMLGVSAKTWQTYRDRRIIPFAQFGRKIMVRRSDIEAFMEAHYIQSKQ
jgi:hypothetical protein